jgi:hypothetical protein
LKKIKKDTNNNVRKLKRKKKGEEVAGKATIESSAYVLRQHVAIVRAAVARRVGSTRRIIRVGDGGVFLGLGVRMDLSIK